MRTLALGLLVGLALVGCGGSMSPAKKLANTVHDLNDEARWGRIGSAAQRVDPSYRSAYLKSHKRWGSAIQIADAEVMNVQISTDGEHAAAFVAYSWYATDTMTLHQSTVRQRWSANEQGYGLVSEVVIQGDPRLLDSTPQSPGDGTPVSLFSE